MSIFNNTSHSWSHRTTSAGMASVCSLDSRFIVTGNDDGKIALYSLALDEVYAFSAHDDIVSAISASPHRREEIATVGWDGCICIWNFDSAQSSMVMASIAHNGIINDMCHSPHDSNMLATTGNDGFLKIWDTRTNFDNGCGMLVDLGQIGTSSCWNLPQESFIAVGREDGVLSFVDIRQSIIVESIPSHKGRIRHLATVPDHQNYLISASEDGSISFTKHDGLLVSQSLLRYVILDSIKIFYSLSY